MKVISLFCGIGGLDKGFHDNGFDVVWANDFDKYAVQTYAANYKNTVVQGDINEIPLESIPMADVVIGGFPCQPFSMMGEKRGFEDARGTLFFRIVEIIKYQIDNGNIPKAIVLENVRNLKNHDNGNTFATIKRILEGLGYKVYDRILNSADYGVPQTRNRTYIVCFSNKNVDFRFPNTQKLTSTLQDLLENNVPEKYFLTDKILPTILSNGTGGYQGRSEIDLKIARPLCATMAKMHRACQDNYVTQNGKIRRLTPRECARLQGFADSFVIPVSDAQAYKQFGNAVTVNVSRAVAASVKEALQSAEEWDIVGESLPEYTDFNNDLNEIKELISSYPYVSDADSSIALNNLTAPTNELYLNRRADFIKLKDEHEGGLNGLLAKASSLCVEKNCDRCPIRNYCNHFIMSRRNAVSADALKMVDLFCGAGGLSLGFTQEGFVTALANDIQECCVDTYAHNHPETERKNIILGDINSLVENLEKILDGRKIDLVVGGPPCQGFSMANRQRLIDDPRNHLYKSYVEVVKKTQPKFFVMENVKGMLSVAQQVVEDFRSIGYEVSYRVFNAKDYGVPQNRERLIYIGNRIGIDNQKIIEEITSSASSFNKHFLCDALFGLKELKASRVKNATNLASEESGSRIMRSTGTTNEYIQLINQNRKIDLVFNHKARYNNDRDIEIFGRMNPGDKSDDPKIADIMPYKNRNDIFKDKYFKLEPEKVCKTITAHMKFDCNMYIHPIQARGLTPREAARVQSYPDDYYFRGSYTKTYMQIGNSVPPLLGRAIAQILKKHFEEVA